MSKNIYVKLGLTFFLSLTPVSVVGCNSLQRNSNSSNVNITQQIKTQEILNKNIDELEKSIDTSIKNIREFKPQEDSQQIRITSIQDANTQIADIETEVQKYSAISKNTDSIVTEIKKRTEAIRKVTKPLNNGLDIKSFAEVQKDLNIAPQTTRRNEDFNSLDEENKRKIRNYLRNNTQLLKQDIEKFNTNLEIQVLNNQVKELSQNLNFINSVTLPLSFLATVLSVIAFWSKNRKHEEGDTKKSTGDVNTIDQKLYQWLSPIIDLKLNSLEQRIQELENNLIASPSKSHSISSLNQAAVIEVTSHPDTSLSPSPSPSLFNQLPLPTTPIHKSHSSYTPKFLQTYNENPSLFSSDAVEVNLTERSIDKRRLGSGEEAIIEHKSGGSYWILKEDNFDYLVPRGNLIFNQPRYNTAQALFQCQGYDPSRKQKFHVTEAAKVIRLSQDKWRLEEKGILEFYSQG